MVQPARSPGLAAVLSFFICGLGQIYNGQIFKGISMIIVYGISVLLMFAIIGLITTPILWIWGMVDAYRTADRLNLAAHAESAFACRLPDKARYFFRDKPGHPANSAFDR
jgi:TM2 domain-containing membrane protein YozV